MSVFGPKGNQPTTLSKDFSRSPQANIERSVFNRDHGLKTTIDAGKLYPIFPVIIISCSFTKKSIYTLLIC